jgi:inorganic pyrophosphatase
VLEPDPLTGFPGDTDPIDVIDVGAAGAPLGIVAQVKVIGALGMIDGTDRQTDWKIYVINTADPMAKTVRDIADVPQAIRDEWATFWRFYKTPGGGAENFFYAPDSASGFSDNAVWLSAERAREIVSNSAAAYRKLVDECLNRQVPEPYWVPNCSN